MKLTRFESYTDDEGMLWERVRCKLDSGAHEWVFSPSTAEVFPVKPTFASENGVNFVAANGSPISNYGQNSLAAYDENWNPVTVSVQIGEVKSNLAVGMRIVQAGNRIILDEGGSFIENQATGDLIAIRHEGGMLHVRFVGAQHAQPRR